MFKKTIKYQIKGKLAKNRIQWDTKKKKKKKGFHCKKKGFLTIKRFDGQKKGLKGFS